MKNSYDHATITLTDAAGRTLATFIKEKADSEWAVASKPHSQKSLEHKAHQRDLMPDTVISLPDGRQRLNVPGPLLPWDADTMAVLDRLHSELGDDIRLTVAQLRHCLT